MRIVITGGAGFLGHAALRDKLLARDTLTDARGRQRDIAPITLVDVVPAPAFDDPRVTVDRRRPRRRVAPRARGAARTPTPCSTSRRS